MLSQRVQIAGSLLSTTKTWPGGGQSSSSSPGKNGEQLSQQQDLSSPIQLLFETMLIASDYDYYYTHFNLFQKP